ncbi:hypothetical protein ABPG77_006135 [Micractinium sp. CCAP 211/92]
MPNAQAADGSGALSPALLQQIFAAAGAASAAAPAPPPPVPTASGSAAVSLQAQQAALASAGSSLGSGQWVTVPGASGAVPVVPPAALSPAQVQSIQDQLSQLQQSGSLSGSLSLQLGSGSLPPMPLPAMSAPLPAGSQLPAAGGAVAIKATKAKQKRPYKPPEVVQAERKQKAEVQEHIRKLEQQLGRARKELEQLQQENKVLHRKAVVLNKHSSFRRSAALMAEELTQSMTLASMDWSQQSASQHVLDAAQRGLPGPEAVEQLRRMSVEEAVRYYNSTVARVRDLLHQIDNGPDRAGATSELEAMFALCETTSTFGYLQVVNPEVYAQLMETKLDPSSPVERSDPAHWRAVLSSMLLSEEQEAQLIILLQSHLQQSEQIVQQKSKVMQQLAEELSNGLLTLELSGSTELSDGEPSTASDGSLESSFERALSGGQAASPGPLQAKDELDRLIQLEYWLKFDFTGCVRKLLPAQQQALCMVSSWPFYPDQRQLEAAIKEKAGQLWDQLQRTAST